MKEYFSKLEYHDLWEGISTLPSKNKQGGNLWMRGVVLSFDLDTAKLKSYFSKTSPQGAYDVIKRFCLTMDLNIKRIAIMSM